MANTEPQEIPGGIEIKLKKEGAQPWHEHHLLASDGYTRTYEFTPANKHTVTMAPADVEHLREKNGAAHFILPKAAE